MNSQRKQKQILFKCFKHCSRLILDEWKKYHKELRKNGIEESVIINEIFKDLPEFDKKILLEVFETIDDVYCLRGSKFLSNHYFEDNVYDEKLGTSYVIKDILGENQLLHDLKNLINQGAFK